MAGEESQPDLEQTLVDVKAIAATATTDEQWDEMWSRLRELRPLGRLAFDRALNLLNRPYWDKNLGCDLLGVLCDPDEEDWSHEAAKALVGAFEGETDPEVLWSIAHALVRTGDLLGAQILARLSGHEDRDIRLVVAAGIAMCRTYVDDEDVEPHCQVLMALMNDEDPEIRDWATFGLGCQTDEDNAAIRDALALRLEDADQGTRWEAVQGLARRHDPLAFSYVLEGLQEEDVDIRAIQSAGHLGDSQLSDPLKALQHPGEFVQRLLVDALSRCDPELQKRRLSDMVTFLSSLERAAESGGSDIHFSLFCPCIENDVFVTAKREDGKEVAHWDFDALVKRCNGDVDEVAITVLSEATENGEDCK